MLELEDLELVQKIVADTLDPAKDKVYVFGSRANGTAWQYSDLDLAFDCGGEVMSWKKKGALSLGFEDSLLPITVDVVDLNDISPKFRSIITPDLVPLP